MIDKITIRCGRAHNVAGSIHVINVLRILSSRNMKYLPSSFSLSPFLAYSPCLSYTAKPTAAWRFAPVNCALDVQLARQHRFLLARRGETIGDESAAKSSKNATKKQSYVSTYVQITHLCCIETNQRA